MNLSYHPIVFNQDIPNFIDNYLSQNIYDKIFILLDENTYLHCLTHFVQYSEKLIKGEILEIESGEENKNIEILHSLWQALLENNAGRNILIFNLGGGVISDMGGFLASTYKRGVDFINVPTTLLAQVDASIGGKTGIDIGALKNQVGSFTFPKAVLIDDYFLSTLDERQFNNGMAEVIKHALICENDIIYKMIFDEKISEYINDDLLKAAVSVKTNIVEADPKEKNERKKLNFGHSIGHALESWYLENNKSQQLFHGEAVAAGMIIESYIALKKELINQSYYLMIKDLVTLYFDIIIIDSESIDAIISFLIHDKKNSKSELLFVLPSDLFKVQIDCKVSSDEVKEALLNYISN
jgi:3-dehydroquinate synthase